MPGPEPDSPAVGLSVDERIGEVLDGRYRIEAVLGIGGLGVVYRAEHTGLRRFVAMKLMHDVFADHEELRRRFEREARALSALDHPNIVGITDFGLHEGAPYLAMDLIDGESLSHHLADGPLPIAESIDILRQVLDALVCAHAAGVVHRDLKPGNIMLEPDGDGGLRPRIVDFGLAKIADPGGDGGPDATLTKLGTIIGSPSYMAPEQTTADVADERADLYALGIILYEMLVGRCPFVNENKLDTVRSHLAAEVPRPESFRPGLTLSPELDAVLFTALAKHRDDRFASAEEMRAAVLALPSPAAVAPGESPAAVAPGESLSSHAPDTIRTEPVAPASSPLHQLRTMNPAWLVLLIAIGVVSALGIGITLLVVTLAFDDDEAASDADSDDGPNSLQDEMDAVGEMFIDEDELPSLGSRPPPFDPLATEVPDELQSALESVRSEAPLTRAQHRMLQQHQGQHPGDARASLILAHDYANQRWYRDAIARYEMVHHIDAAARGTPWMLQDLLDMVPAPTHGPRAMRAVRTIYGSEALSDIERRLNGADVDARARRRLGQLHRQLE